MMTKWLVCVLAVTVSTALAIDIFTEALTDSQRQRSRNLPENLETTDGPLEASEVTLEIPTTEESIPNIEIEASHAPEEVPLPSPEIALPTIPVKPVPPTNPNPSGRIRCQSYDNFTFLTNAQACSDERGSSKCKLIFTNPDPVTGRRDPRCDLPGLEDVAKSCSKQCGICCEHINYACQDDTSGLIDCQKNLEKCKSEPDIMGKYCAGSCGLCQHHECKDSSPDCGSMKGLCTNPAQEATMKTRCARTCGYCTVQTALEIGVAPDNIDNGVIDNTVTDDSCVDVASNCDSRLNLCTHPTYYDYMTRYCAKSCRRCGPDAIKPSTANCQDSNPGCANWNRKGFCSSTYYTVEYKKKHCAKSCNLC